MGRLKNYIKLVSTIKTIDQDATPDYNNDVRILNKAIGELMVLTPQQIENVLEELNNIYDDIQTFAERYWIPEKFDLKNEFAVIIYKRFLSEHFYITWPMPDVQDQLYLDLETMRNIVWRIKYNSTLLHKIKNSIKQPQKRETKPKLQTFEGLFRDKSNAQKIKDILEKNGYTEKGYWRSESGIKSEPMYAYYVLIPLFVEVKNTPGIKVFLKEFGLSEDHISNRQKTNKPDNKNREDFERIFSHLITK